MNSQLLRELAENDERLLNAYKENPNGEPNGYDYEWLLDKDEEVCLAELSQNEDEAIYYIDNCSKVELSWASQTYESLIEKFHSNKLLECFKRNITRFDDNELQNILNMQYEYAVKLFNINQNGNKNQLK
jgi:hypothetical protein